MIRDKLVPPFFWYCHHSGETNGFLYTGTVQNGSGMVGYNFGNTESQITVNCVTITYLLFNEQAVCLRNVTFDYVNGEA
jgi:hypothetical protein